MKFILILSINIYKAIISPFLVQILQVRCRYGETCSDFAKKSIEEKGVIKGLEQSAKRFLSCQPFAKIYV